MLGCDSIRLENAWRLFHYEHCSADDIKRVPIRGGMYEVGVRESLILTETTVVLSYIHFLFCYLSLKVE